MVMFNHRITSNTKAGILIIASVFLLVCGITITCLTSDIVERDYGIPLGERSHPDSGNSNGPLYLWQSNQNIIIPQSAIVTTFIKSYSNTRNTTAYWRYHLYLDREQIPSLFPCTINTVFKQVNGRIYQCLDIPPPHTSF